MNISTKRIIVLAPFRKSKNLRVFNSTTVHERARDLELNLCLCPYSRYSFVRLFLFQRQFTCGVHCKGFFLYQGFLPNKTLNYKRDTVSGFDFGG